MRLSELNILTCKKDLELMSPGKRLINAVNAYSFCLTRNNKLFVEALKGGDYLIPDGAGIVLANRFLKLSPRIQERVAGWDLFIFEMTKLQQESAQKGVKSNVLFIGSTENVLEKIRRRVAKDYPNLVALTYSPPFKKEFSHQDDTAMIEFINGSQPDLVWIGMTAPKQEIWAYTHWDQLNINCHLGSIGAVFDFYAGTVKRAPLWWQEHSLEWLYRFLQEPRRTWRRYLIGNPVFISLILKEKIVK